MDRETAVTNFTQEADYDHVLPSLDFDIGLTDTLKGRFSYSKTIARAQYDQLRAAININGPTGPTITGGVPSAGVSNPALVPLESDNLDLSLEWYFGESSYVSAGLFEKRVSNFIGTEQVEESFFGLRDVTAGPRALAARDAVLAITDTTIRDVGAPVNETELFVMTAILDNPAAFPERRRRFPRQFGSGTGGAGGDDLRHRSERERSVVCVPDLAADQQQGSQVVRCRDWRSALLR